MHHNNSQNTISINERDADRAMSLKTWWALVLIQPLSRKLVVFVVNRTSITPNQITLTAMFLRLITAFCFLSGSRAGLVFGAVSYFFAYVCDCADGTVARITKQSSELGRYLDHVGDLIGDIIILTTLSMACGYFCTYLYAGLLFMHISECYISYLAGIAISDRLSTGNQPPSLFAAFNRYRQWLFSKNLKSFFSFPDYTAIVFILFPVIGFPGKGLQIGFWFLLMTTLYTVLSTFVSIHSGFRDFP